MPMYLWEPIIVVIVTLCRFFKFPHANSWLVVKRKEKIEREKKAVVIQLWTCSPYCCSWTFDKLSLVFMPWLSYKTKKEPVNCDGLFNWFSCHMTCSLLCPHIFIITDPVMRFSCEGHNLYSMSWAGIAWQNPSLSRSTTGLNSEFSFY